MAIILPRQRWQPVRKGGPSEFIETISDELRQLEIELPSQFPDLARCREIVIASDYGGQHQGATYRTYTFFVADLDKWCTRAGDRNAIRYRYLPDGRSLEFKKMRSDARLKALDPFLTTVDHVPGVAVTVLIDRRLDQVIRAPIRDQLRQTVGRPEAPEAVFEDMIRVSMILTVLIAGLWRNGQKVVWISDNDPIVDAPHREHQIDALLRLMTGHYVEHGVVGLWAASTRQPGADALFKDLLAIPDLVAGALGELLDRYHRSGVTLSAALQTVPTEMSPKTRVIMNWLARESHPLKRWVFAIGPAAGTAVSVSLVRMHSSRSQVA